MDGQGSYGKTGYASIMMTVPDPRTRHNQKFIKGLQRISSSDGYSATMRLMVLRT